MEALSPRFNHTKMKYSAKLFFQIMQFTNNSEDYNSSAPCLKELILTTPAPSRAYCPVQKG
jgi:hypothetical protein